MDSRGIIGGLYMDNKELNKELYNILNQHGFDVLVDVISDMIADSYNKGNDDGYTVGYHDALNSWIF